MEKQNFFIDYVKIRKEIGKKKGVSPLYRTASTTYPCFLPDLGEFSRSWSYKTYPGAKLIRITWNPKLILSLWLEDGENKGNLITLLNLKI